MTFAVPDVAIGAIAAAAIAAVISLLGLIISKEQKVSELRQAWIDALRADLARLIAHALALHGARVAAPASLAEQWMGMREDYVGINDAAASIRLRLNPTEAPSAAILGKIDQLEALFASRSAPDPHVLNELVKQLVELARPVLKAEWLRVRRGEPVFRLAKWLAALLTIMLLGFGLLLIVRSMALTG